MDPQAVTIPAFPTSQTRLKDESRAPTPSHQISFEDKKCVPPRVEADIVIPVPQTVHKYLTRQLKSLRKFYKDLIPVIIAYHAQKITEYMTDTNYLNMLEKLRIGDETG